MTGPAGHVVLSPHPDDAVWSAGGRIRRWVADGVPTTVVTVFDGDGTLPPGEPWRQVADPVTRRREDIAALARLGVRRVSLGLPEAAVRADRGTPRYGSPLRLFGRVHERDTALADAVADVVAGLLEPGVEVHAPLGAGGHVDHRLVRAGADRLAGRPGHRPARIRYYEDFPYRLRPADHEGLRPGHAPVDLPGWLAAAGRYHGQVAALFGSPAAFEEALRARARDRARGTPWPYADRFWSA